MHVWSQYFEFLCFAFDLLFIQVTVEKSSELHDGQNNKTIHD